MGVWQWESGFDHDPIEMSEYIRDWNFRAAYGAWDALKNTDGKLPNHKLNWMAHISGKRESRRLLGDVILTRKDMEEGRVFEDGCVPVRWPFDVHFPDPRYDRAFQGDAFIATTTFDRYPAPFWIPYRSLYSRNIENMFMAGRDISVTHMALGAVRVMRTGGCMGEVVGLAASICIEKGATPRGVWKDHLDLFKAKLTKPVYSRIPELPIPPEWKGRVGGQCCAHRGNHAFQRAERDLLACLHQRWPGQLRGQRDAMVQQGRRYAVGGASIERATLRHGDAGDLRRDERPSSRAN